MKRTRFIIKYICLIVLAFSMVNRSLAQVLPDNPEELLEYHNNVIEDQKSHDTSIVIAYVQISELLYGQNPDTIIPLCEKAKTVALEALKKNPSEKERNTLNKYLADALNNIGFILERKGDIEEALNVYHESLKLKEELGDKTGVATAYNNIGLTHQGQLDYDIALDFYYKSLALREETGNKWATAQSNNNIGLLFFRIDSIEQAKSYYSTSLQIRKEINDKNGIAQSLNNFGLLYMSIDSADKAVTHFNQSLVILKEVGYKEGMPYIYHNLAEIERKKQTRKSLVNAEALGLKSLELGKELGFPATILGAAKQLSLIYEDQNKGMKALEMHKLFVQMKDSINNDENKKTALKHQAQYEYEKQKVIDDKENEKRLAVEKEKQKQQYLIILFISIGSVVVLVLLFVIYRRLRVTRRQKRIIEEQSNDLSEANEELNQTNEEIAAQRDEIERQKQIVETAHDEVQASITYAERIQNALLSTEEHWQNISSEHFILFQPRDVVSGDFYWAYSNKDLVFWVAADCTGHGVPGAFMSMLGVGFLNEIVAEGGETNAGKILDKLRAKIIKALEQTGDEERKDGMDLALCILNKKTNRLQYAGAYNPLFIVRPRSAVEPDGFVKKMDGSNHVLYEFKASRMPIGSYVKNDPFKTQDIQLLEGDLLYTFTDGYQDQFGGKEEGKFMVKRMKKLLVENAHLLVEEQNNLLSNTMQTWMKEGNQEQVDDVCIIGVKL